MFMQFAKHYPEYKFIIAGPGAKIEDNQFKFESYAYDLEEYNNITYVGLLNKAARNDILTKVTALLQLTQYSEPFGMNVIESLACGTPVIVTGSGSMVQTVKHGKVGFVMSKESHWDHIDQYFKQCHTIDPMVCRNYVIKHFNPDKAYLRYSKFITKCNK